MAYSPCGGSKLPKSSMAVDTTPNSHIATHMNNWLKVCQIELVDLHEPLPFTVMLFMMSGGNMI